MPKSFFTIGFFTSFLVTLGTLQWWQESMYPIWLWMILGYIGVLLTNTIILHRFVSRLQLSIAIMCCVFLVGSSLAFLRVSLAQHQSTPLSIESFASDNSVTLKGIIVDEPDRRPLTTKYTVAVYEVEQTRALKDRMFPLQDFDLLLPRQVSGKVLVTDHAQWPEHQYGDEVLVSGILERPDVIEGFQYDKYLSRYGIYSVMYRSTIETISAGHGNSFFAFLYRIKRSFESQINRLYAEPHASFLAGLLTGSRRGIPEHLLKDFQATGLTHIIAISGYNVSIVIAIIMSALFFLPLKWRFCPAVFAIVAFTLFVGASPSVVRAAIMGGLGLFALQVSRQQHSFIAILLTASVMTAWNPSILWYDAGFQLSFLAVLGLSFLAPYLDRFFSFVPHTFGLRESLQMTIAAQLTAVPLIVILFGQLSLIAPIANVLVAPLIPLAMLFGFVGVSISFFSFPIGQFIAFFGWAALEYIVMVAQWLARMPFALVHTGYLSHWIVWFYYAMLIVLVVRYVLKKQLLSVHDEAL